MLVLAIVVLILLIIGITKLIPSKGQVGEKKMALRLKRLPKEYVVLNNVIISPFGLPTQIDHVVVSPYGIFVIETKNHKGSIYGGENEQYWTQNIFGEKYKHYNPILQNKTHVNALRKLLQSRFGNLNFISIIAYTNKATLHVDADSAIVTYVKKVVKQIKKYNVREISDLKVSEIVDCIEFNREFGKQAQKNVVKNARKSKERDRNALFNGICPRCGGELVKRKGKYGNFWGCANFPRCKYTKDIE
jgi:hypothetical protein